MILTLIALWVVCCVIFFGSLAVAAGQPLPPIDREALLSEPLLADFNDAPMAEPEFAYSATSVRKVGSMAG
jgi:hypothetical protein